MAASSKPNIIMLCGRIKPRFQQTDFIQIGKVRHLGTIDYPSLRSRKTGLNTLAVRA